jgi:hypothetical protein
MRPDALPWRPGARGAALAALTGLLCALPVGARAQQRLTFQERGDTAFLHPQAVHVNTGFTGTPGWLEVRQWTLDERAAFPDLTGNTLRMRLDEAAATPGDGLQCLPATLGLTPWLEGSGGSDVRSVAGVLGNALEMPAGRDTHVRLVSRGVDLASDASAVTLMGWMRPRTWLGGGAGLQHLINVGGSGGTRLGLAQGGPEGMRAWAEAPDAATAPLTADLQVPAFPGVWRMFAAVFELAPDNRLSFYLDGRLLSVTPLPFSAATTSSALSDRAALGSDETYNAAFYEGALDEPSVWKRALPPKELRRIWLRQSGPYGGGEPATFVSRVLDSGGPRVRWDTLGWTPRAPAGKGLPDQGATETGYAEGNVSMAGNVLLLHAEGTGALEAGATVPDASGRGHAATFTAPDGVPGGYVPGRVGAGLALPRAGYLTVAADADPDFDFGQGDFTWAAWVRTSSCQGNNLVVMGAEGSRGQPHVWFGGGCESRCPDSRSLWVVRDSTGSLAYVCHPIRLDDGEWHHLVGVKSGQGPTTLTLYVDGEPLSVTHDYAGDFSFDRGPLLGQFPGLGYPSEVMVDEVAIWRRALSAREARDVWRRGSTRLKLQVRACDEPGCAGVPFAGPDGTAATFFSEATHGAGDGPPGLGALGPAGARAGRYFQYAVSLETDSSRETPGLTEVTVQAANSAPVGQPETYAVPSHGVLQVAAPGVLANDADGEGGPLRAVLTVEPALGTLRLGDDGAFQYNPGRDFDGTDRFRYRVSDGALESAEVEVVLTGSAAAPGAPRIDRPAADEVLYTRTPVLEGTAEAGVEVELVVDGTVLGRTTADAQGRWRYAVTPEQALPVGSHRAVAYALGVRQSRSEPSTEVPFGIQSRALEVTGWGCGSTGGGPGAVGLAWLVLLVGARGPGRRTRPRRTR